MKENCKYRLPCGWCDRRNKMCEAEPEVMPAYTKTEFDKVSTSVVETAISSSRYRCGKCSCAEFVGIIGGEKSFRCKETSKVHFENDKCDIEYTILG